MTRDFRKFIAPGIGLIGLLILTPPVHAQTKSLADPYPMNAAGWGPSAGKNLWVSRWVEDWTQPSIDGKAKPLKAVPLVDEAYFTFSGEVRLRYDLYQNGQLTRDNNYDQGFFRAILGTELRLNHNFRLYGEIGTGQVEGRSAGAAANNQNEASFQQLFLDARGFVGSFLLGAMVGRQEFTDGPKPLVSLGDGSNLHRTWNGGRLYLHDSSFRLGAYFLMATRLGRGFFDEDINEGEILSGINASLIVIAGSKGALFYLDPFWIHSENPAFRSGGATGLDNRDSYGARFWGKPGSYSLHWTLARQTGQFQNRAIDAWGFFTVQNLALFSDGWKPRAGVHLDCASGGGYGKGSLGFNQIYSASTYLSEGLFLSTSNLLLISPLIAVSPMANADLSIEYGFADRLREDDAAYAGKMGPYAGTQKISGYEIGTLLRVTGTWMAAENWTLFFTYEYLATGDVLRQAGFPSGGYGYAGATFRY